MDRYSSTWPVLTALTNSRAPMGRWDRETIPKLETPDSIRHSKTLTWPSLVGKSNCKNKSEIQGFFAVLRMTRTKYQHSMMLRARPARLVSL